jgi:tetratricopeptide (TPR) repeat protein
MANGPCLCALQNTGLQVFFGKEKNSRMKIRAHHAPSRNPAKWVAFAAVLALLLATTGCTKLRARDQLNKGVQAYKANKFEQAITHFQNSINLDPSLNVAKLYLATACAAQYVPGGDSVENLRNAECALENFKRVLETDPKNVLSLKGIASLYLNMKKFEEAKDWNRKAIQADPNDQDNYYSVAVIDWTQSYVPRTEARLKAGLTDPTTPLVKDKKLCEQLSTEHMDKVNEGIEMLNKSLEIKKDYDDAMAYMNLLYRERADYQCGDQAAREADLKTADEWVEKAKTTRQAKADKAKEQHGIVLDSPGTKQ